MTVVGNRVRLLACTDPYTRLEPGEEGTVSFIDSLGTVHVKWDSGSSLGLVPGHDRWEVVDVLTAERARAFVMRGALVEVDLGPGLADHGEAIAFDATSITLEDPVTGALEQHAFADITEIEEVER